jgi:transcriptional regulator GlxA family with amidase domain
MKHLAIIWPNGGTTLSSLILSVEVINTANGYFKTKGKQPVFTISIVGDSGEHTTSGPFIIRPHKSIQEVNHTDLIIIPSLGDDIEAALKQNKEIIEWVTKQYKNGAEIAGLCTGTFILAAAGLLKDKQCSTHWNAANIFGSMFPEIDLAVDKIITEAHGVYTTGGALSSMNLVLHIIEKYYDRDTAIYCAKVFEIDPDRNSQSGFIIFCSLGSSSIKRNVSAKNVIWEIRPDN